MRKSSTVIERVAESILDDAQKRNIPLQGQSMRTFAQFEDELEEHFDAFHDGTLSRHKLRKYLSTRGFSPDMIKAEIAQQIEVRNFKNEARRKDRHDSGEN